MNWYITYTWLNYSYKNQEKPEKLPPAESAPKHHNLWAHYQILKWKIKDQTDFSPTHWGWKNCEGSFEPIDTILESGPAELLNVIRCYCKLSAKTPCVLMIALVAKSHVTACGNSHGNNCTNVSKFEIMDDSGDESFERNVFELFDV